MWARYYRRWAGVALSEIDVHLIELLPQLAQFVPPARLVDKHVYSPWTEGKLDSLLQGSEVDSLVIAGIQAGRCIKLTDGSLEQVWLSIVAAELGGNPAVRKAVPNMLVEEAPFDKCVSKRCIGLNGYALVIIAFAGCHEPYR